MEIRHLRFRVRRTFVVLSLLGLVFATGAAHGSQHTQARTMTIRLISVTTGGAVITDKVPKNVLNPGDVFRVKSVLRNEVAQFGRAKGAVVGSDSGVYNVVSASTFRIKGAARFPGGSVLVEGLLGAGRLVPVVGGTGAYAGARGTVKVSNLSNTRSINTYRLQLP